MAIDTVQQIKDKLDIKEVVGAQVKLIRAGRSLRGICPFHKEKTPSFYVSPERGTWHCFGCGLGGDIFSFTERIDGVDFKGALNILAEKAGVSIEYKSGKSQKDTSKLERMREAMSRASAWYANSLKDSSAFKYAKSRGITETSIKEWGLGFALNELRVLLTELTGLKDTGSFSSSELLSVGLIKEAEGKSGTYYDRFRNRLMFPIRDISGRVVAFTGRILPMNVPNDGKQIAKYLNSPETDLYHKSEILFGMDRAKDAIRTRDFTCLVEGQTDVILAHQAGFTNTVALSGTALSSTHLSLMKRYSENLLLILDADTAGLKATASSAALALLKGLRVKVAMLPKGKDPADLIKENTEEFTKCITEAKPVIEFFLFELSQKESDPHKLVQMTEETILPLLSAIQSPMEREHFIQIVGRVLGLSDEAVRDSLNRIPTQRHTASVAKAIIPTTPARRLPEEIRSEQICAIIHAYPNTPLAEHAKTEYFRITGAHVLPSEVPPESVVFSMEQTFGEDPTEDVADELIDAFEEVVIRDTYKKAVANLRRAEATDDDTVIKQAQEKCAKISVRLAQLGK